MVTVLVHIVVVRVSWFVLVPVLLIHTTVLWVPWFILVLIFLLVLVWGAVLIVSESIYICIESHYWYYYLKKNILLLTKNCINMILLLVLAIPSSENCS